MSTSTSFSLSYEARGPPHVSCSLLFHCLQATATDVCTAVLGPAAALGSRQLLEAPASLPHGPTAATRHSHRRPHLEPRLLQPVVTAVAPIQPMKREGEGRERERERERKRDDKQHPPGQVGKAAMAAAASKTSGESGDGYGGGIGEGGAVQTS